MHNLRRQQCPMIQVQGMLEASYRDEETHAHQPEVLSLRRVSLCIYTVVIKL